jgi:hypothetical protein
MDSNVYKNFMDWHNLISDKKENKKDFIYKRELLIEIKPKYNIDFGFPIARQVVARSVGLDLVSVQPLSAPTGLLFYMDFDFEDFELENIYKRIILVEKIEKRRKSRRSRRGGNRTEDK